MGIQREVGPSKPHKEPRHVPSAGNFSLSPSYVLIEGSKGGRLGFPTHRRATPIQEERARVCRTGNRSPRHGVGRSQRIPSRHDKRTGQAWAAGHDLSRRSTAAPAWATSNTSPPSKNFRASTVPWASSSRRIPRCARITFSCRERRAKKQVHSASWPRASTSAHGD